MKNIRKLWKVVITHKMGAQAPSYFVETEYVAINSKSTKENKEVEYFMALQEAKQKTRLSDFPNEWTIDVINTGRHWDSKKEKWWE